MPQTIPLQTLQPVSCRILSLLRLLLGQPCSRRPQLQNAPTSWLGISSFLTMPVSYLYTNSPAKGSAPHVHYQVLHRVAGWPALPHRVFSSPPSHAFSVYPRRRFTSSTVALSPVFLPMLSLILTAWRPDADAILMTIFSGTDFLPVDFSTKSSVYKSTHHARSRLVRPSTHWSEMSPRRTSVGTPPLLPLPCT